MMTFSRISQLRRYGRAHSSILEQEQVFLTSYLRLKCQRYQRTSADFARQWDAKAWVDLFADSGAQYFVLTTKHHDGFAMFDTKDTTHRNSLHYGPKRDVLKELFDAAKKYQPHLHRGTYFSLPEWVKWSRQMACHTY